MDNLPISSTLNIKECGYDEYWLQEQIWNNPSCLQLGELEAIQKEKIVSSGGKLDILLKNPIDDSMYEVEVMLGETDPSHIIRTIEYWDLIKKKWSQRQHFAVLVAEKITKRFFNVIQIFSNSIPLIAIQANIIDINGTKSLHFTKILDAYEEPDDDINSESEKIDRSYWTNRSEAAVKIADEIIKITEDIYKSATLVYNKGRISISSESYNQMTIHKRTGAKALLVFRFGDKKDEIIEILDSNNISYIEAKKHIRLTMNLDDISKYESVIKKIAELNKQWWL